MPSKEITYVDSPTALEQVCVQLADSPWLAVDTEFFRETTYFPIFCLLQLANAERIVIIDVIRLDDIASALKLLCAPHITKVFHAARQDLEIFYHAGAVIPTPVFDTQTAAALLGESEQIGYAELVQRTRNVSLEKSHTRTDWRKRPLTDGQLEYAADDVRYLGAIYLEQKAQLERQGKSAWLEEEMNALCHVDNYRFQPQEAWRRLKGLGRLRPTQQRAAARLALWREETARKLDRPRRSVMRDEWLLEIAKRAINRGDDLSAIKMLPPQFIARHAAEIVEVVNATRADTDGALVADTRLTPQQREIMDVLMPLVRDMAEELGVHPHIAVPRRELEKMVRGEEDSVLARGWRWAQIGRYVQGFVRGEMSIVCRAGKLAVAPTTDA